MRRRYDQCSNPEPNDLGSRPGRGHMNSVLVQGTFIYFQPWEQALPWEQKFLACWSCENWGKNKNSSETAVQKALSFVRKYTASSVRYILGSFSYDDGDGGDYTL